MLKVCIIGGSGHYSYATERGYLCNAEIIAIAEGPDKSRCDHVYTEICKKYTNVKYYTDYTIMLDEENPDIAVVNPYMIYNAKISIDCLKRGIHVFSEKPAATTLGDLADLAEAYKKYGKIYSNMMDLRFAPGFYEAKLFIDAGGVGEVRLLNARKSYKLGTRGDMYKNSELFGGLIPWVGIHAVDWFYYFTGSKFLSVYASESQQGNKGYGDLGMTAVCHFNMENEVIATVTIDYMRPEGAITHGDDRVRIVGTSGVVEVQGGEAYAIDATGEKELVFTKPRIHIFDEFIKAVSGEANNLPTAKDAFYVTEVCIKARMAAETGKVIKI